MAIFNAATFSSNNEVAAGFAQPTDTCFYCGEALDGDEWIYWQGMADKDQQIWLHPRCAKRLSDELAKDWQRFVDKNPHLLHGEQSQSSS